MRPQYPFFVNHICTHEAHNLETRAARLAPMMVTRWRGYSARREEVSKLPRFASDLRILIARSHIAPISSSISSGVLIRFII
jgi:hypothetical protein